MECSIDIDCLSLNKLIMQGKLEGNTQDGTVDRNGHPAIRHRSGTWVAGIIILGTQF